jgi:BspA type Leucine rich repeat region (6 copies)
MKRKNTLVRTVYPKTMSWFLRVASVARLLLMLLLLLPVATHAQFIYTTNNSTITITGYTGSGGVVTIPNTINGMPVTDIGDYAFSSKTGIINITIPNSVTALLNYAFAYCYSLTNVTIGNSVASIGVGGFAYCYRLTCVTIPSSVTVIRDAAFSSCSLLTGVYFEGNAPSVGLSVFADDNNATVYYFPGTKGWGSTFAGRPSKLWNSQSQAVDASFGVKAGQFGFNVTGDNGLIYVVETTTDLTQPVWSPLRTNTLAAGTAYFSDPQWTNYPARLYRLRMP